MEGEPTSKWAGKYNAALDLYFEAEKRLAELDATMADAKTGRCRWTPETDGGRGGWRCTADEGTLHEHRYLRSDLPANWSHGS
jgi:hypothetical protein